VPMSPAKVQPEYFTACAIKMVLDETL
jgi:hypothetical protein